MTTRFYKIEVEEVGKSGIIFTAKNKSSMTLGQLKSFVKNLTDLKPLEEF